MKTCITIDTHGAWLVSALLWNVMTLFTMSAAVFCLSFFVLGAIAQHML